jgi:hypothetical protein
MNTNLAPDLGICENFLDYCTGGEDVAFRTFDDQESARTFPLKLYGQLDDVAFKLTQENQKGSGVFWVVNKCNNKQTDATVTEVRAVFVDLDGAELAPVIAAEIRPHVLIESSPGKFHAYWLVSGNFPVTEFSRYQKALARKFNGDPVVSNLSRVMRLPGFYHRKDPSNPFMTRVMNIYDQLPYGPSDILEGLRLNLDEPENKHLRLVTPTENGKRTIPQGQRDVTLTKRAASLRNAGLEYKELLEQLLKINSKECEVPLPEKQVDKIARSVSKMGSYADESTASFGSSEPAKEPAKKQVYFTFEEIDAMEDVEIKWAIPDLLPQGLVVLAGAPKMGKSWLVQQLSCSIATGGVALSKFPTNQGSILHLALEDPVYRFRDRMKMQKKPGEPSPNKFGVFANEFPFAKEGIKEIRRWCDQAINPRMVVIDTLERFKGDVGGSKSQNVYSSDYQTMSQFHSVAKDYGISVVIVHHLRKADASDPMNQVSGSAGITGAADMVWVLNRKSRKEMKGTLQAMGKDLGDTTYSLIWDGEFSQWICEDFEDADQKNKIHALLIDFFKDAENRRVTAGEVADKIGKSKSHVAKALKELADEDFLLRYNGGWNSFVYCLNPTIF